MSSSICRTQLGAAHIPTKAGTDREPRMLAGTDLQKTANLHNDSYERFGMQVNTEKKTKVFSRLRLGKLFQGPTLTSMEHLLRKLTISPTLEE